MKAANENEATTEKKSPRRRYIMHETTKGGSRTKKKDNHVGSSTISTCHRHNHPAYVKGGKEKEPSALPPPYRRRRLRCDMSFTWALSLSLLVATTNRNRSRSPQNPKVYEPRRTHEHYPVNSGRLVQVLLYCNRRARGAEDEEASEL